MPWTLLGGRSFNVVLRVELRALSMLSMDFTTELYPYSLYLFL